MTPSASVLLGERNSRWLLVGMGVTNRSVAAALLRHGHAITAVDDSPGEQLSAALEVLGIDLVESPTTSRLSDLVEGCDAVVVAPGLPESHEVFAMAAEFQRPIVGELDLAAVWDDRPVVAITGTNGKTTVVELVIECLTGSGFNAVGAGNTEIPLVAAIEDPTVDLFVVEASSFRLARTTEFEPTVATWINFAPDHLDVHADLGVYESAKASIWARATETSTAIANLADDTVMSHVPEVGQVVTFGVSGADWSLDSDDNLCGPDGPFIAKSDLWRSLPHDVIDALAAAATSIAAGANMAAVVESLRSFQGLAHRVYEVATIGGSIFYDDSKATTPHATVSALRGLESAVLIAGGRNKGIDLSAMLAAIDHVSAVVAIGDSAEEIRRIFSPHREVETAFDMDDAVARAARLARGGRPVLLSPGCASFDWYRNYGERGDDFARSVRQLQQTSMSRSATTDTSGEMS